MAEEGSEGQSETGGSLRAKLETALEENKQMVGELRTFKATQLITEKGYKYVTAADLEGVGLDELATKAATVESDKVKQEEVVLRDVLQRQGLEGAKLETAVKNLLHPQESHADTSTRLAGLGRIQGDHPSAHESEGLEGRDAIRAYFEAKPQSH